MKKSLVILLLLFFVVGALITITNFSTKAVALAPEVEGQWVDDESCGQVDGDVGNTHVTRVGAGMSLPVNAVIELRYRVLTEKTERGKEYIVSPLLRNLI